MPVSQPPSPTRLGRRTAVPTRRGHTVRLDRHPEAPDPTDLGAVRRWIRSLGGPTAVDLFAGGGGLGFGLREAGFTVVAAADSDQWAMETHVANVGGVGYVGDLGEPSDFIEHLKGWGIDSVDLVAGGPPCQPFSRAGQSKLRDLVRSGVRAEADPRATLWQSFMRIVAHLRPRAVLVENVPNLPSWDDGAVLMGLFESFRSLDYSVDARVIDCFLFGVPQHRARLFIVATQGAGEFRWPEPRGDFTSLRDAIGDLPMVPGGQRAETLPYRPRRPLTPFQRSMRARMDAKSDTVIHDHVTRSVRPDDLEAYQLLDEGQTYADLPERLRRYRSDIFTDKYKRLAWDELSRTITAHLAKDGYWYIHPEQHRTLSVREAARVQTFPDRFRFAGQPSHRFRQVGNAVPPMMAEILGAEVIAALRRRRRRPKTDVRSTRNLLVDWHKHNSRQFPWRGSELSPWHVLMAEMCLHRTRADQVAPVFEALVRIAPTPERMVKRADEALAAMRSLGLRWRAENVVAVAQSLVELFDGEVPDDDLELRMLPGVGDYVAQAVRCFGFGRHAVLIDTNTVRITSRLFGRDASRRWQLRVDLHRMAGDPGPEQAFNYALLDLGALVCTAGVPACIACPLRTHCVVGSNAEPPARLALGADHDAS